jgi:hypothetical protein
MTKGLPQNLVLEYVDAAYLETDTAQGGPEV